MKPYLLLIILLSLSACESTPTYQEQLNMRSLPQNMEQTKAECGWIRGEISRQNSLINQYSGVPTSNQYGINLGAIYAQQAPKNIASLETRASNINCRSAFSSQPATTIKSNSIQQCITACKENTSRTAEMCFDSCNK